jgi:hypothetical protein
LVGDVTVAVEPAAGGDLDVVVGAVAEDRLEKGLSSNSASLGDGFDRAETYNFRAARLMALSITDCVTASSALRLWSDRL